MCKKLAIVASMMFLLALMVGSGAHAGIGGFTAVSAGSVTHPSDFDIIAMSGSESLDLDHVLGYNTDDGIDFAVSIPRNVDLNRVGIVYSVGGAVPNVKDAIPVDLGDSGWTFSVNPPVDPNGWPVPIHIGLVDKKGERDFIRVLFKITPNHKIFGWGPHATVNWITFWAMPKAFAPAPGSSSESALEIHIREDQAFAESTKAAIVSLNAGQQTLVKDVNEIKAFLRGGQSTSSGPFVIQWTTGSTIFVRVNGREGTVPGRLCFDRPDGTSNVLYWSTTLQGLRRNPQSYSYSEKAGETLSIPMGGGQK